eukprot:15977371-Heterocapsa_arctica.AAC.1
MENTHLFTGTDDLARAVRVDTINVVIASEVPESRDSVLKAFRCHGTELLQGRLNECPSRLMH